MAERHPEADLDAQGAPWVNGGSLQGQPDSYHAWSAPRAV